VAVTLRRLDRAGRPVGPLTPVNDHCQKGLAPEQATDRADNSQAVQ
jgi:hypothetical protein